MKIRYKHLMLISGLAMLCFSFLCANKSLAEVDVDVHLGIPLPAIVIGAPPAMVMIVGTPVYFAPDLEIDIFFHHGYWYRPYQGRWFRAFHYGGPWHHIAPRAVPSVIINLPPGYRNIPPGQGKIPYGQFKKHWKNWEKSPERGSKHGRPGR